MRQIGAEGIVSKRRGSIYRAGESRDWIRSKVFEVGEFAVTAFNELSRSPRAARSVSRSLLISPLSQGDQFARRSGHDPSNQRIAASTLRQTSGFDNLKPDR